MRIRNVCVILGIFLVATLIMVSCTTTPTTTQTTTKPPATTTATSAPPTTTVPSDKPIYGGQVAIALTMDPAGFDQTIAQPGNCWTMNLTNQELLIGDWTKGAAGSNLASWTMGSVRKMSLCTGGLAESWEITDAQTTMVFHIRHGMNFGLNSKFEASRLVAGREINAKDVAATLKMYISTPMSPLSFGDTRKAIITTPDDWTLQVTLPPENFSDMDILGDYASSDIAPELYTKYGKLNDWKNNVGTGAYMIDDYITGSSATLIKNPNYWEKDPIGLGKGQQLPYVSTVKYLIIPDQSTRIAGIRTARLDILTAVFWEDAKSISQTNQTLKQQKYYDDSGLAINMREDKTDLPYQDVRVRQALMMATDFETIKNTWAGGEAQVVTFPILNIKEYADAYCPIEEASATAQSLYKYSPDKAKELLAAAGYPDGFSATVVCSDATTTVDYLSIIKDMWSKVNVQLTIQQKESGVYSSIFWTRAYDNMFCGGPGPAANLYIAFNFVSGPAGGNFSYVDDPVAQKAKLNMMGICISDPAKADAMHKDLVKYELEQATSIPGVCPPSYNIWWPWVKNYHGEASLGYTNYPNFIKYIWVDQNLKKEMRGG